MSGRDDGARRRRSTHVTPILRSPLPLITVTFLALGVVALIVPGTARYHRVMWTVGLVVTGAPVVWRTVRGAVRGRFAADIVATLAIVTSLLLHQPLVGLVIVLMQTGGEALERYAEGRASEAVRALEAAAPRTAHRVRHGHLEDVSAEDIVPGDVLLIRPGELVACDSIVLEGRSHIDTSAITGEPLPVTAIPSTALSSGSLNIDGALTVRATALARESQYARIVDLVRSAQASRAPLQRIADR
ncbi:MAG TPA: hypothetical protein VJ596_03245, partial [Gemmatimonadaceae bacterium]|nr:hypothetical protein [Gemmatimonadaceae bacterium]